MTNVDHTVVLMYKSTILKKNLFLEETDESLAHFCMIRIKLPLRSSVYYFFH